MPTAEEDALCRRLACWICTTKIGCWLGGFDDALQEARLGRLRARQDFDPERGRPFLLFARYVIRHHLIHASLEAGLIRLPNRPKRIRDAVAQRRQTGEQAPGRMPAEPIPGLSLVGERVRLVGAAPKPDCSAEELMDLPAALARLAPKDRAVLRAAFGFVGGQPLDFQTIGRRMGVSRQRAYQRYQGALAELREFFGAAS